MSSAKRLTLNDVMNTLHQVIDLMSNFREEVNARFERLEDDINLLKVDVGVINADVSVLKNDVGIFKGDVNSLKNDVGVLKSETRDIKEQLIEVNVRLDDHNQKFGYIQEDIGIFTNFAVRVESLEKSVFGKVAG